MIKKIDNQWYEISERWELLDEPSDFEKQKCLMFRSGQKDRKEGKGCLQAWGSYLDGWYNPDQKIPPYVTKNQAAAFNL